jgi:hypothetical protein
MSGVQMIGDLGVAPIADAGISVLRDVVGPPAVDDVASELVSVVERLAEIARRMAVSAMGERLNQVGAAVPFR